MNCKLGDLAVIVHSDGTGEAGEISRKLIGRIVRVVRLGPPGGDLYCYASLVWFFEDPVIIIYCGKKYIANGIADFCLRPIRPGESHEDSTEAMRRLHDTTIKQGEPA